MRQSHKKEDQNLRQPESWIPNSRPTKHTIHHVTVNVYVFVFSVAEIFADGYHPAEKTFTVSEGVITNLSIQLVPLGLVSNSDTRVEEGEDDKRSLSDDKLTNNKEDDADHEIVSETELRGSSDAQNGADISFSYSHSQVSVSHPDPDFVPILFNLSDTNNNMLIRNRSSIASNGCCSTLHVFRFQYFPILSWSTLVTFSFLLPSFHIHLLLTSSST